MSPPVSLQGEYLAVFTSQQSLAYFSLPTKANLFQVYNSRSSVMGRKTAAAGMMPIQCAPEKLSIDECSVLYPAFEFNQQVG